MIAFWNEFLCFSVLVAYSFLPQSLKDTKFHEEDIKCETLVSYFSSNNLKNLH
jgi:hypothetical protein